MPSWVSGVAAVSPQLHLPIPPDLAGEAYYRYRQLGSNIWQVLGGWAFSALAVYGTTSPLKRDWLIPVDFLKILETW